jgi:hypothetical protein
LDEGREGAEGEAETGVAEEAEVGEGERERNVRLANEGRGGEVQERITRPGKRSQMATNRAAMSYGSERKQ